MPADQTADGSVRDQVLHALDFSYCHSLGYGTPEELLDAYDQERAAQAYRDAADALDTSETLRDHTDDHMSDVHAAANELRRLADTIHPKPAEEQQ